MNNNDYRSHFGSRCFAMHQQTLRQCPTCRAYSNPQWVLREEPIQNPECCICLESIKIPVRFQCDPNHIFCRKCVNKLEVIDCVGTNTFTYRGRQVQWVPDHVQIPVNEHWILLVREWTLKRIDPSSLRVKSDAYVGKTYSEIPLPPMVPFALADFNKSFWVGYDEYEFIPARASDPTSELPPPPHIDTSRVLFYSRLPHPENTE